METHFNFNASPCRIGSVQRKHPYECIIGEMQVKTVDGRLVWRRRHYRVRRAKQPGTFTFSVLDNGVISKEYWRCSCCCCSQLPLF